MSEPKILAMVMAGGEGNRLNPLTAERSKPSVPFGGRYRIVDFVLSNLINSRVTAIYLLVQYKSQSLIEHVRKAWMLSPVIPNYFVTVVPPQMRTGTSWFQGTSDAVYQNLNLIYEHCPDMVAVFGADHIYRMDLRQMAQYHAERNADVTVAAIPVPLDQASSFGIIATDEKGQIQGFEEKPKQASPMPGNPNRAYASMGNYLFNTQVLEDALEQAHEKKYNDFGKDVLPALTKTHRVFAYDFSSNQIPGIKPYEEKGYWRDVGTIEAYFEAHRDLLGLHPCFDEFNPKWPIYSSNYMGPVAKVIDGQIENSIISAGTIVNGAKVKNSIIRREVLLEEDVEIEDCIISDYVVVKKGSRLRRTIVDRSNVIEEGSRIGYDAELDRKRFRVSETGLVIVPQGKRPVDRIY